MSQLRPGDTTAILPARQIETFHIADIDGKPGISADDTAVFVARETRRAPRQPRGKRLLEFDLDRDNRLTLSDVDLRISRDPVLAPRRFKVPPDAFDADSDGRITEGEFRAELDRWIAWSDLDADGVIAEEEIRDRRLAVQRADAQLNRRAGPSQNRCILPPIASTDDVAVIHANTGSAFIDLTYGGDFAETVHMGEVVVPPGNAPLWIVASFGEQMLLRIDGATEPVAGLISVAATTGMTGHPPHAHVFQSLCHSGFLGIQVVEQGQNRADALAATFARALRREAVPVFAQDMIGRLDLATGRNDATVRLAGDDTPSAQGDARYTREALYLFSPGGFHDFAPDEIAVPQTVRVGERPLLPLEAGLLQLIELGLVEPVVSPRSGVIRRIPPGSQPPEPSPQDRASRSPLIGGYCIIRSKTVAGSGASRSATWHPCNRASLRA